MNDAPEKYFEETSVDEEREVLDEMAEQAKEAMAKSDPRDGHYFQRADTGAIVSTEIEYEACRAAGLRMRIVSYNQAINIMRDLKRKAVTRTKVRAKNSRAKASRRRNR